MANPWNIDSIYELQYFNCPSCIFKKRSKQEIISHAYEYHPESINFLTKISDDSLKDVICPWNNSMNEENLEDFSDNFENFDANEIITEIKIEETILVDANFEDKIIEKCTKQNLENDEKLNSVTDFNTKMEILTDAQFEKSNINNNQYVGSAYNEMIRNDEILEKQNIESIKIIPVSVRLIRLTKSQLGHNFKTNYDSINTNLNITESANQIDISDLQRNR